MHAFPIHHIQIWTRAHQTLIWNTNFTITTCWISRYYLCFGALFRHALKTCPGCFFSFFFTADCDTKRLVCLRSALCVAEPTVHNLIPHFWTFWSLWAGFCTNIVNSELFKRLADGMKEGGCVRNTELFIFIISHAEQLSRNNLFFRD